MNDFLNSLAGYLKPITPYIMIGIAGTVVDRMRREMSLIVFLKQVVMSIFISICVGVFSKEFIKIENDNVAFVICGISGTFSKLILDEFEQIIKLASEYVRVKTGINKKKDE